ncbi:unnamed protein product [Brassica rapa subsp. trilocularis]
MVFTIVLVGLVLLINVLGKIVKDSKEWGVPAMFL